MTVKVVHLVTSFDTGGLQTGIVNLINRSDPDRFRHVVLSIRPQTALSRRLERGEVESLDFGGGRSFGLWRRIAARLRAIAPDVLHARNFGTWIDGALAARAAGVRAFVYGFHGRDLAQATGENFRRRLAGRAARLLTDRLVTLTPSMALELQKDFGVRAERVRVIPNGIDLGRLEGIPAAAPASPFTILTVGRLDPVKNLPMLLRAFAGMRRRDPMDRLLIVGEGPERERLTALSAELGLDGPVRFLGERADVPALMKSAQVYVQPSFYEGMSNTIVEAMACGLPVVATDVGGNADVAGRGDSSILVPSDDPVRLAQELDRLRSEPELRASLAAAGARRVLERFTLDRMVAGYSELWSEVARKGRRSQGGEGRDT